MNRTLSLMCMLILITFSLPLNAQNGKVTGCITDSDGLPVIGASILVKGTTNGIISDLDGNYILENVPMESTLIYSFVGYDTQNIVYKGQSKIDVQLKTSAIALEEVVAIGYEVKKKSVVTGAISSIDSDDLLQSKPANAVNALSGRVSGVNVVTNSGQPGSAPKLVIRGVGTNGNSNPLFVIDGLPMDDMNSVNPNDIESMEVLKDATSAAIYGARAANGVVLITTKKGKKGKTSLAYDGYYGFSTVAKKPTMLNDEQYIMLMKEFADNDDMPLAGGVPTAPTGYNTDWFNEILNTAPVTEHNITANFGSDKGSSLLSLNYLDQNGIIGEDASFYKRFSTRLNSSYSINDFLSVGANVNYAYIENSGVATGINGYNPISYAYNIDPTTPVYDENSNDTFGYGVSPVPYSRMWNPIAFMDEAPKNKNITQQFFGNVYAEITFIKDLVFRTDFGINHRNFRGRMFAPKFFHSAECKEDNSRVEQSTNANSSWQWENTLRYKKSFGEHSTSVLLGTSASRDVYEFMAGTRNKYPNEAMTNENYWYLNAGDVMTSANSGGANPRHSMFSYFARLSYNYAEKYMAEVVVRRDGSSNFGPNNRYATFPGVSLGWNVSNEKFWKIKNFDVFKLRFSWGQNGNERISPFSYTSIIGNNYNYTFGNAITVGSAPNNLVNPDVKWETSEQFNVGADMTFYNGMIRASFDWFKKSTKDLLFQPTVEAIRGNNAAFRNLGNITNQGVEMQMTFNKNWNEINFSISANASYLKNEVVKIGNANGYTDGGSWRTSVNVTRMEEGHAMGYFRLYKNLGIFQNEEQIQNYKSKDGKVIQPDAVPGDFIWQDTNNDGQITDEDRTDCGNPWPKWTFGLNLGADWRGIDMTIFLTGKAGYKVFSDIYRQEAYGRSNLPSFYLDRWRKEGDDNGVPRLSSKDPNGNFGKPSDFYLYDGSHLKISSLEVGYSFPTKLINKLMLNKARIYAAIDNLATFTSYPFMDPEVGNMAGGNILSTGIDYGTYPQARTFRFGLSLNF